MAELEHKNVATLQKVLPMLQGSFALGILSLREPEKIFAVRLGCPLIVGSADGASYLGSDVSALLEYTRDMFILEDLEIAVLQEKGIAFQNALIEFANSNVYNALFDFETGLWMEGPDYLRDMWEREKKDFG